MALGRSRARSSAVCVYLEHYTDRPLLENAQKKSPAIVGLLDFTIKIADDIPVTGDHKLMANAKSAYFVVQTLVVFIPLSASDLVL